MIDLWWFFDLVVGAILVAALVLSWQDRDLMRRERDIAVNNARRHEVGRQNAMDGWGNAIKMLEDRDRKLSALRSDRLPARETRAVKVLQAELAEARKILSENNLLKETHKGGRA